MSREQLATPVKQDDRGRVRDYAPADLCDGMFQAHPDGLEHFAFVGTFGHLAQAGSDEQKNGPIHHGCIRIDRTARSPIAREQSGFFLELAPGSMGRILPVFDAAADDF